MLNHLAKGMSRFCMYCWNDGSNNTWRLKWTNRTRRSDPESAAKMRHQKKKKSERKTNPEPSQGCITATVTSLLYRTYLHAQTDTLSCKFNKLNQYTSRHTDSQHTLLPLTLIIDPILQQVIQCHLPGRGIQLSLLVTIPRLSNDVRPAN